jgi:hypothetical protein
MQVGLGKALPNAPETKLDRGAAKIANVDPTILGRFTTWLSMQKENAKQVKKKSGLVRNYGEDGNRTVNEKMFTILEDDSKLRELWMEFRDSPTPSKFSNILT